MIINAHRGMHEKYPENSLESFLEAFKYNADGIELDIVSSESGELFVMHDLFYNPKLHYHKVLANTAKNNPVLIDSLSSDVIKDITLLSNHYKDIKVPTLKSVIAAISKLLLSHSTCKQVYLEIKTLPSLMYSKDKLNNIITQIHVMLEDFSISQNSTVMSFDYRVSELSKKLRADIKTGLISSRCLIDYSLALESSNADTLICQKDWITEEETQKIQTLGKKVFSWTPNTEKDWKIASQIGVDGIMTDSIIAATKYEW